MAESECIKLSLWERPVKLGECSLLITARRALSVAVPHRYRAGAVGSSLVAISRTSWRRFFGSASTDLPFEQFLYFGIAVAVVIARRLAGTTRISAGSRGNPHRSSSGGSPMPPISEALPLTASRS